MSLITDIYARGEVTNCEVIEYLIEHTSEIRGSIDYLFNARLTIEVLRFSIDTLFHYLSSSMMSSSMLEHKLSLLSSMSRHMIDATPIHIGMTLQDALK